MAGIFRYCVLIVIFYLITACSVPEEEVKTSTPTVPSITETPQASSSPTLSSSLTPTKFNNSITPTKAPVNQVCSPLDGISLSQLSESIVNPFQPPRSGSDDPHQGVDFASRLNGDSIALEGFPVATVLDGEVVAVIDNRFPYGNAIMIETSLNDLSRESIIQLQIPTLAPTRGPHPALTCPMESFTSTFDSEERSLYLLYAHLQDAAPYELEEEIQCGQILGATGSTGNALNPHIHLEIRVGPSGARFQSMAHYDTSATEEEMAAYCVWRVSDQFQLFDPMQLLE